MIYEPLKMADAERIRRLERMVRNLGEKFQTADGDDFIHASGQAVCDDCGLEYFDHPTVDDGVLRIRCDGKLVKT